MEKQDIQKILDRQSLIPSMHCPLSELDKRLAQNLRERKVLSDAMRPLPTRSPWRRIIDLKWWELLGEARILRKRKDDLRIGTPKNGIAFPTFGSRMGSKEISLSARG